MTVTGIKLPSPRVALLVSSVIVVCAWLVFDLAIEDPSTILFAFIALGSDFVVRNVTSGLFADRHVEVVVAARLFFCFFFFVIPGLGLRWLGARWFSPDGVSGIVLGWLLFYLAALSFLFDLGLVLRML